MSKQDLVKVHLQNIGSITSWDAITHYRATRLSAIIFNLKKAGMNIITEHKVDGDTKYAIYRLVA